ncbi:MAG: DUF4290 domain-containing protein [Odoribacter sp.]|nr:DUF4290 domain-containing protein [Bacteroidales bacterium]MBR2980629.1 DUF4290 domain-containing protein [Odoribacter sp.]
MDYNTQRKKLLLPEYGRNIQSMVDYLLTIEDRDKRTEQAYAVIDVMGNLNPQLRDVPDFRHKLWDHLAIMSDFKLDIDAPYELPEREILHKSPEKIPYSSGTIRARHYGKSVEKLVEKIKETTDPEQRRALIALTANHMKKSYLTWNRDSVEDNQIISDINEMYGEELIPMEGVMLSNQKELLQRKNNNGKNNHSRQQRKGGNGMQYRRKQ